VTRERRTIAGRSIRWDEQRVRAAYAEGLWIKDTLANALAQAVKDDPERVLIIDGEIHLDVRTLHAQASNLAQILAARFELGSAISFMLPNWHEAAVIYLAATMAGMIANPVLPSLREHDLCYLLKDVDSRMIFIPGCYGSSDYEAMLTRVVQQLETPLQVVVVRSDSDQHIAYNSLFEKVAPHALPSPDPDAVRMIMYTSGTTGSPKGVMHSHNSIHALIQQIGQHWLVEPGDTFLVASPISHIGGSIYAFECPLLLDTCAVLMERWNPDDAVENLVDERCTHFAGATPFLVQLLQAARRAQTRLPDLKLFVCGGASVPPSLIREAADYFERAVVTRVYGSTEVPVTTVGVTDQTDVAHAAQTDGLLGIAQVKLTDAAGAASMSGEIRAQGPQMLVGYIHAEDEGEVFDAQGFYRTGDLGQWVDDDYLLISGRSKDIIIRNGENIAPKEIEDLLAEHPDIAEVAIVGLPDPKTGERACAVIVPRSAALPDIASLYAFLDAKKVAKFKIPEQVEIWDELPRNAAGKVLKHQMRSALAATES
jgi:acyl-CoA synthetase (AMP-forming)/AMP-acid ligase II